MQEQLRTFSILSINTVKGGPKPAASPRKNGQRLAFRNSASRRLSVYSSELLWLPPVSSKQSYPFQSRPWPPRAQPCPGQESPQLRYRPPAARGPLLPRPLLSSAALRDAPVPARRQALPYVRRFRLPWE